MLLNTSRFSSDDIIIISKYIISISQEAHGSGGWQRSTLLLEAILLLAPRTPP